MNVTLAISLLICYNKFDDMKGDSAMNAIGKTIVKYRKLNDMSRGELALKLSVDLKTLSKWESGREIPDGDTLSTLSETLGFPLEEIISENAREIRRQKMCNAALLCISVVSLLLVAVFVLIPSVQSLIKDREELYNSRYGVPVDASIVELIATPERFHGKLVRVIGVGNLEFEGNYISLNTEEWRHFGDHRLWISLGDPGITYDEATAYNGKYVIVEGIFNMNNSGHGSLFKGAIENVSRYDLWDFEQETETTE